MNKSAKESRIGRENRSRETHVGDSESNLIPRREVRKESELVVVEFSEVLKMIESQRGIKTHERARK